MRLWGFLRVLYRLTVTLEVLPSLNTLQVFYIQHDSQPPKDFAVDFQDRSRPESPFVIRSSEFPSSYTLHTAILDFNSGLGGVVAVTPSIPPRQAQR